MSYIGNTNTTQAFTPAVDYFSGNASTTAFTLSRPVASVAQVQVNISNVPQNPSDAYTVSSNTITFTSAPPSGTNNIYVYYTSPITQVIAPSQGTVGTTQIQNGVTVNFADGTAAAPSITNDGDTNTGIFFPAADTIAFAEGGAEVARFDSSGNLGIGTSSPAAKLDVYTNTASGFNYPIFLSANNAVSAKRDYVQLGFSVQQSAAGQETGGFDLKALRNNTPVYLANYGGAAGAGTWQFYTDGTERMRITSAGLLLINTTTTAYNEQVKITFPGTQAIHCNDSISSSSVNYIYFSKSASLTNVGAVYYNGSVMAYQTTSDYRLKENIAPITGALSKIAALKPVTYTWKDNQQSGEGFIAHELQEHFPDAVSGIKDDVDENGNPKYQGMDASILIATLTAAIQELKALTDTQASTITALTARITALENK